MNLQWKEKYYGVPVIRSTPLLYINKNRFKAAGLDPAKPPQTWTEFRSAARKLTSDPERSYAFAVRPSAWYFETLVFGAGGELVNEAGTRAAFVASGAKPLQLWSDMIHRDKTARLAERDAFERGEAAMFIESTALVSHFERSVEGFQIGTAFIPCQEGEKPVVATGGGVAVLPAKLSSEKQRAAETFLTWLASTEQTAELSGRTGYVPLRKSAVDVLTKSGFYDMHPNYLTAVKQMEFARQTPSTTAWPQAMSLITKAMRETLEKDVNAQLSLLNASAEVDRILAPRKQK